MTLEIGSIVWGVRDVPRAIAFWCTALDYRPQREPSEDWAILVPPEGHGVQLAITIVSSDAKHHQRHHLDRYAADQAAEVLRLIALGASRVDLALSPGGRLHRPGRPGWQQVLRRAKGCVRSGERA